MSASLVVQFEERVGKDRRTSYNITYVPIDKGIVVDNPVSLWQPECPGGDVPPALPFTADIEYGMRQFRTQDGGLQQQPTVACFKNIKAVKLL
jgi:hypothetical protein